jgi:HlyD family secretion protein
MNRKWMLLGVGLLLIVAGCGKNSEPKDTLFVSGRIDGDTVDVSSKYSGRVLELTVREGASVEAGQVLARIVSAEQEAQVEQMKAEVLTSQHRLVESGSAAPARVSVAEANLAAAKADLVRSQAELAQAQRDAKRYPPLVETGAAAAMTADQHETSVKTAQASVEAGQKAVAAAEASLDQAKAQLAQIATSKSNLASSKAALQKQEATLDELTITAPIAGTIITRSAEPGRVVSPGQTIYTMVDMHKLYLRGFIPEGDIGKVKIGQKAQVYLDSNPKEAIDAEVIRIDPQAMFTPENIYFQSDRVKQVVGVKIALNGAFGYAKLGMPADGRIRVGAP